MASVGRLLGRRGIGAVGAPSEWGTLQGLPHAATSGSDVTPVTTEEYLAEIYIGNVCELTGIAVLNGSAVAGNILVALYDVDGKPVAQSASTAQAGIATLQSVPFTSTVTVTGPGVYYCGLQCNNVAARFRAHTIGISGASKKTGVTFGTVTAITPPSSFTTALGPIATTY